MNRGVLRVVDTATRKVTGTLRLAGRRAVVGPGRPAAQRDRALVLFSGGGIIPYGASAKRAPSPGPRYVLVDLSGEGKPKVIGSLTPDGAHVDARMVARTVRIVVAQPAAHRVPRPSTPACRTTSAPGGTRRSVAKAPIEAWLPKYELTSADGVTSDRTVDCGQVSHPAEYTGTSMLTVHSLDRVEALTETAPIGVAADGDTVYGTGTSLYVAQQRRAGGGPGRSTRGDRRGRPGDLLAVRLRDRHPRPRGVVDHRADLDAELVARPHRHPASVSNADPAPSLLPEPRDALGRLAGPGPLGDLLRHPVHAHHDLTVSDSPAR
ncbi:beta-propeller domain-containing protein [Streptosporangium vulgare]|uniref:beta-propeller domain-containing protein n=1 Tax=Streptosporangium vulgare TaxID=46190 RepID=UPI0031D5A694